MYKQDFGVLLFYFLGFSKIRNLIYRSFGTLSTRMVVFHHIPSKFVKQFETHLLFLKQKTNVISLDDFFANKLSKTKTNIIITFDDGYESWISTALPVLKKLELPATFFVSSGLVGLSNSAEFDFMKNKLFLRSDHFQEAKSLSIKGLELISRNGFTIGGHTINHCNLTEIKERGRLLHEIRLDKMQLENIIKKPIDYFSYPFGQYNNPNYDLPKILKEIGYKAAVTVIPGNNYYGLNPYLLRRVIVDAAMNKYVFRGRTLGNHDAVVAIMKILEKIHLFQFDEKGLKHKY